MSSSARFEISILLPSIHNRTGFDCGVEALNRYLQERATQDMKRKAAGCWVLAAKQAPGTVLGYYTLSPEAVDLRELGDAAPEVGRRLPRYPRLGAVLLGRLAVASSAQGKGIGQLLLYDALHRALRSEIPVALMVTDPKDGRAEAFYRKHGFGRLNPERLFIAMQQVSAMLKTPG